jgi:CheY-like chemotaxis protein
LSVVRDGVESLSYLRREEDHRNVRPPDLILLDVNIPKKSGIEVLAEIKSSPGLKLIPVLMLTTADSIKERRLCEDLKADGYLRKPVDLNDFLKLIVATERFWRIKLLNLGSDSSSALDCDGLLVRNVS